MPQQIRKRTENIVEFSANNRKSEKLDRGFVMRELYLKLTANIAVAGAGEAVSATNIEAGGLAAVIRQLELIVNNNDSIRVMTGEELLWYNFFLYGSPPLEDGLSAGITAGANADLELHLILPFWMPRSIKPMDTALDARLLSDVKISVDWGDVSSITSSPDASFGTNPQLEIFTLESFGLDGPFNTWRIWPLEETDVQNTEKHRVELPVGNMYRSFLINTKDANGADIDGLDNIKLRSGSTVFVDLPGDVIRRGFFQRNGLREVIDDANGGHFPYVFGNESDLTGWYYLDLVTDGLLSEAIDTIGFSSLVFEFDTNQTIDTMRILPSEIIPIRR